MTQEERRLLKAFRDLPADRQQGLLDYADFLAERTALQVPATPQTPLDIPRPDKESVVKAIKRLRQTYPMIDRAKILHETSAFMTQHLVHGKPAQEVIDELEGLFRRHYEEHLMARDVAP
ncbi:MAG: hypothetical protein H6935_00950 [Thiobacillus sp.]|nr:hypothetical protein [Thiobacillus sp.]